MASSLTGISIASSYDSLLKVGDNDGLSSSLKVISDGLGTETGISLNNTGDLTATGTITANSLVGDLTGTLTGNISGNTTVSGTLTFGSLSDGTLTMTDILDEDNMSSDSATALATQQSIKAYVDAQVTASDLDYQGDSGGQQSIDLDSEVFNIAGTSNEVTTAGSGNTLTIGLASAISGLTSLSATSLAGALTGNVTGDLTGDVTGNITGNVTGNVTGQVSDVSNHDTDDISEGSTNLYFSDARADARVNLQTGANLDLSSKSTSDLSEGTNLYYTSARFDSALAGKSTTDLSEGTNLYYTDSRADARIALQVGSNLDLSSKDTDDLSEGTTNKYFTDERVDDRVASLVVASTGISSTYDDVANTLTIANTAPDQTVAVTASNGLTSGGTYPNLTVAGDDATTSAKGVASFSSDHFSVSSGAVSLAADSIDDTLIDFGTGAGQVNSDDLPEGSANLYFTNERVDDQVGNNLIVAGSGIGVVYDDNAGTLTISSTASGIGLSDFSAATSGIGSLAYNNTNGVFTYTGPTKSEIDGLGIAATSADTLSTSRNISGVAFDGSADITLNTSAITENTNLYYTDARVQAVSINAVSEDTSPALGGNLAGGSNDITTTGKIYYANVFSTTGDLPSASTYHGMFSHVHATGKGYFAHAGNWITLLDESSSTTDNLTEGSTNLYYTTARGNSDFDTRLATKSTTDLAEGTNLYYTDARFDTRLSAKTSDDLTEGSTNLYNQTHTGDVTGSVALTIASDAVTYDKMQDLVTANRVLGGTAAGTIAEVQIATDMIAAGAVTAAKVDTDLRNVQYIGLDSTDYMEFTDNTQIDLYINGSNEFRFEADGDFHADGDVIAYSTTTPSDERLKENVKVIDNPLEKLDKLRGVTFDWIDREDKRSGGIIAQELEKVMPELVREVDSLKNEDSFKAVDYNGLIGLLIEAVKELSDKCNNCKK
jgi:hypothetical protein